MLWLFRHNGVSYDVLLQRRNVESMNHWSAPGGEMLPDERSLAEHTSGLSKMERNRVVMISVLRGFLEEAGGSRRPPFPPGCGYPADVVLPALGGMNTNNRTRWQNCIFNKNNIKASLILS